MNIRIGTRSSPGALWQAHFVRAALLKVDEELDVEIVKLPAEGENAPADGSTDGSPTEPATHHADHALVNGDVEVVVQRLQDVPTDLVGGVELAAIPCRQDPADGLISQKDRCLRDFPQGAMVLTGSPRRRAELLNARPDLDIRPVQGDIPGRIKKMRQGHAQAVVVACAGLCRMGMAHVVSERLDPERFVPAAGQGAIAVECRKDDPVIRRLCAAIDDPETRLTATAERSFMRVLGIHYHMPAGTYARTSPGNGRIRLIGLIAEPDGSRVLRGEVSGQVEGLAGAAELGQDLAEQLQRRGCDEILKMTRRT